MSDDIKMRGKESDGRVIAYIWLALTLLFFFILGVGDVSSLFPFFDGGRAQLVFAHLFLSVFALRSSLPLWCYLLLSPFYDFAYGDFIGMSGTAFVVFFLASMKLKDMGGPRSFFVLWCLFSLLFMAVELLRNIVLFPFSSGGAVAAHWGGGEIVMYIALNILLFPFAYGLLLPLKSKEK